MHSSHPRSHGEKRLIDMDKVRKFFRDKSEQEAGGVDNEITEDGNMEGEVNRATESDIAMARQANVSNVGRQKVRVSHTEHKGQEMVVFCWKFRGPTMRK